MQRFIQRKEKNYFSSLFINFTRKPGCLIPYMIVTYFYGGTLVPKKKKKKNPTKTRSKS